MISGCKKEERLNVPIQTSHHAIADLYAINQFSPEDSLIPEMYKSFRKEMKNVAGNGANLKDGIVAEDRP
nr:hypothetical protein [Bacteroidota bacterium]